jgi:hypothetical protein
MDGMKVDDAGKQRIGGGNSVADSCLEQQPRRTAGVRRL